MSNENPVVIFAHHVCFHHTVLLLGCVPLNTNQTAVHLEGLPVRIAAWIVNSYSDQTSFHAYLALHINLQTEEGACRVETLANMPSPRHWGLGFLP